MAKTHRRPKSQSRAAAKLAGKRKMHNGAIKFRTAKALEAADSQLGVVYSTSILAGPDKTILGEACPDQHTEASMEGLTEIMGTL